jgi:hypothetical protein
VQQADAAILPGTRKEVRLMFCAQCGQENDDQSQFCRSCGASLREPSQPQSIQLGVTEKRIFGGIGLIAGILALVGVFAPWVTVSGWGESLSASAWDSITRATIGGEPVEREAWACLALAGAILAVVGALAVLAIPKAKEFWGILGIGGILAIVGSAWGFSDIETGSILDISVSYGYGLYLTLVGGILGLVGIAVLRGRSGI